MIRSKLLSCHDKGTYSYTVVTGLRYNCEVVTGNHVWGHIWVRVREALQVARNDD